MRIRGLIYISFILFYALNPFAVSNDSNGEDSNIIFFEKQIRPILVTKCFSCHSEEAKNNGKLKAGLLLDSAESIIKGGDSGRVISPG